MAAPHNLSFHSNHTSEQSLQTPDASSLLLHANNETTPRIAVTEKGFDSLEELLNDAGINTDESTDVPPRTKRSLADSEFSIPSKRFKVGETNVSVSAGLTRPTVAIPSILSHSSSTNHIPSVTQLSKQSGTLLPTTGEMSIPLINPATSIVNHSSSAPNNLTTPLQSTNSNSSLANIASLLSSQPPLALGSISLLVQLYKQFQEQGNLQGMQKIKEQLSVLQSQIITKSKSLSGQTGLTGTINITPSLGNSFQPVLIPTINTLASSTSQSLSNNPTLSTLPLSNQSLSNGLIPGSLLSSNQSLSNGLIPGPSSNQSLSNGLISGPSSTQSLSNGPSIVTNGLYSNHSSLPMPSSIIPSNSSVTTIPIADSLLGTQLSSLSTSSILPSSGSNTINTPLSLATNTQLSLATNTPLPLATNTPLSLATNTPLSLATNTPLSSNLLLSNASGLNMTSLPSNSASSSFVTQMSPSAAQLPLGLQVTPQTQANVLKAVYSYRLQQIQDFLSSLPLSQKPTTTQELRELLIKNNVLSKALPADFLTTLQKMSPHGQGGINLTDTSQNITVTQSQPGLLPTTSSTLSNNSTHNLTPPISTMTTTAPLSTSSPITTESSTPCSSSQGNNVSLPGVTLETLKTLCRLPEADFIRIPMPAMLMTIVHFLRSSKWSGSSADLPALLKQAQEALAKNALTNVTPTPPVVQVTKMSSTMNPLLKSNNKINNITTTTTASPLSQLMANFGMKATLSSNNTINSTTTAKPSASSVLKPVTRHQTKVYQEQLEREKIANLQRILQSSEEARIAFRFKAHVDKLNQQLLSPDINRPFTNWQDMLLRLLPYHAYRESELPAGAMEKADAVYEGIAGVLLSRSQGLMSRYQQIVIEEEKESGEDKAAGIVLDRLWLDSERERKNEEERERKEAEEVAAELSVVGGGMTAFDSDPFLLESDSYDDDPFLSQLWGHGLMDQSNDFGSGIT